MADSSFLSPDFEIRWSTLTADQVEPGVRQALTDAQAALDALATLPLDAVTYDNTFLALERATESLTLVWGKVTHLKSVADSPALREAHNKVLPEVSTFFARIALNPDLWARLRAYAESPAGQAHEGIHRRFIDETVADFRQAGADLPDAQRARLEAIQTELAQITQRYSEHVLDATNAWQIVIEDETRLAGIPAHARESARRSAASKGLGTADKPAWRFTLQMPSLEPVMVYAEDEALRRAMWSASTAVGATTEHDNRPLVPRILALRDEEAKLLGQPHFADHVLARRMAGSGQRALDFVVDLQTKAAAAFARENAELEAFKADQTGEPVGPLKAWEVMFWAEKLRRQQFDFDDEILRPYLPMNRVIGGLFTLAERVFGLRITERPAGEVEVWHEEVKFYEIRDRDDRHVGSFYADWHPRESKQGGAWMGYLITGGPQSDGSRLPHLGYILGNMTPPADGKPALLTHREVETIFHEFGHLLHHLLGEVEIKSLNGVNVAWDFVELPSQIMENWCWERESLDLFARHHETGETIPDEVFAKMIAARNFRSACATIRQVQFAKMDLLLHMQTDAFIGEPTELDAKISAAIADTMVPTEPPGRPMVYRFGHLFSGPTGYAAGYYSYKWAEVLDADAFGRFKDEGIFNADTGADFVRHILSRGNSADPAELFRAFRGRDPEVNALLERSGLLVAD
ncbi:M3 family metallopeptidase [Synoicihabitans lomoniglobus]|uniref:oligopeptidase A n=1 Tax=Synoicihabitans lomoniglobus TaxID=2909285 RepID=A0AAF0I6R1_9BACT|nr:M3 family metallopeptidase [Opitutaceae bacterium LMO-M01]WED66241.1 M3 family metallopeptidase [Opitutaceae bacterium LMO-M01]